MLEQKSQRGKSSGNTEDAGQAQGAIPTPAAPAAPQIMTQLEGIRQNLQVFGEILPIIPK